MSDRSRDVIRAELERDGRSDAERWKAAAIQAKDDLLAIEDALSRGLIPVGEGERFARWSSPGTTIEWIRDMERVS